MSDFSTVCDAVMADLLSVAGLSSIPSERQHKYAPWDPELLQAAVGERHIAVYPVGSSERADPASTDSHELAQGYAVLIWEGADTEPSRLMLDETAAAAWLDLENAVRARFYVTANQGLGGLDLLWYSGVVFPERPGPVRWMLIALQGWRSVGFT